MTGPIIDIWHGDRQVFGQQGRAQPWVNVLGRVSPSDSPIYTVAYQLNDGPSVPVVLGPSAYRLRRPGDFNIEVSIESLTPGENTVRLRAIDEAGHVTQKDVPLDYAAGQPASLPYRVVWSETTNLQQAAQVVDGQWSITPAGVRPVTLAYDRVIAIGDMSWTNYQVTVPITVHGYETTPAIYDWPSFGPGFGVIVGWQGHRDWGDITPKRGWWPFGALGFYRWRKDSPMRKELWGGVRGQVIAAEPHPTDSDPDRTYIHKLRSQVRPGNTNHYSMKIWPADEPEPAAWTLTGEGAPGELSCGAVVLLAHHTDATFGDVLVEPL